VRVGHVVEVQRVGRRKPRDDANLFDAQQDEGRPHDVEELDSHEEDPEGNGIVTLLGEEADAVMAYEHG